MWMELKWKRKKTIKRVNKMRWKKRDHINRFSVESEAKQQPPPSLPFWLSQPKQTICVVWIERMQLCMQSCNIWICFTFCLLMKFSRFVLLSQFISLATFLSQSLNSMDISHSTDWTKCMQSVEYRHKEGMWCCCYRICQVKRHFGRGKAEIKTASTSFTFNWHSEESAKRSKSILVIGCYILTYFPCMWLL